MSNRYSNNVVPTSLYVRNVPHEARPEEIKHLFSKYGHVSDAYLPLDYYTRAPRGFAYVQFDDERDAEDAMYNLDRTRFMGRELEVELARGDRKSPGQMRTRDRPSNFRSSRYSRSRSRSPRRRRRSYSPRHRRRSPSRERHRRSRSKDRYRHSPPKRERPRTTSKSRSRSRSTSRNPKREPSRSPQYGNGISDNEREEEIEQ